MCYTEKKPPAAGAGTEEEGMSVEELTALLLAVLREEVLAHCTVEGSTITLHFTDFSVRTIRIE